MSRWLKIFILTVSATLVTAADLYCGPVRNGDAVYSQPDGSTFAAKVKGDEWTRIRTTADGHVIAKDSDGWWCYGKYDQEGRLECTEHIVGHAVPSEILSASRFIPYAALARKARERRMEVSMKNEEALRQCRQANSMATRSTSSVNHKKGLAILAQFQDVKFTYSKEDFHKLLNEKGYNGTGSAKDYYEAQFGKNWEFTFDVSEIVTLPNNLKYYGENDPSDGNDIRAAEMIRDACRKADEDIDFAQYDQDGDGEVDNVYVFVAGHDEAENTGQTELIWPHQWYVYSGGGIRLTCDGVLINRYACSAELSGRQSMTGIGHFCHEYAHTFGLPDFYDTNYDKDNARAAGLWKKTSLMDGGNYNNDSATPPNFNCVERNLLGLSEPVEIQIGQSYKLEPVHRNGQYFIMKSNTEGEYYLFECRSNEGWDQYIGGKGMLVYHIDRNGTEYVEGVGEMSRWTWNTVNADPSHQCVDLIEADGRNDLITDVKYPFNNIGGIFFPQPDRTSLTPDGHSSYRFWDGSLPEVSIARIASSDEVISFTVTSSSSIPEIPDVTGFTHQAFPDAMFISFVAGTSVPCNAIVEWKQDSDEDYKRVTLPQSQDGSYSYLINGLQSGNTLYEIQVRFENEGAIGKVYKTQLMTKRSPATEWPYLYFTNGGLIKSEEGFIAHVINAAEAVETAWYLDGKELEVKEDCRIYPQKSGRLSCVLTWKNGSMDTIVKEITISEQ